MTPMMTSRRGAAACFVVLVAILAHPLDARQGLPRNLDDYVEDVREDWGVVGLAVAVVKDGEVVYARGFGRRTLDRADPVDEHTLFAIGSNTKAFTAAGIGILVDEGKMRWDDRVIDHVPAFALWDPWVTREFTIRDLLSHRSGLGRRGDANWYATDFDRDEIVRRIRYLEPNSSFRSAYGYQNTMFLVAGEVTDAVAGTTWDEWIARRIFRPLGMTRSNTSVTALDGMANVASPHAVLADRPRTIPYRDIDNIAPAGSINSSVLEMTYWMRMMLNDGEYADARILSPEVVRTVWTPHAITGGGVPTSETFPTTHFSTYGLGWGLRDYAGHFLATHTGGIDGMLSQVALLPEEELGIVVLTNTSPNSAYNAITYPIIDGYLGRPERDWNAVFLDQARRGEEQAAKRRAEREQSRVSGTSPTLPLAEYAGTYENPMYGELCVALEDGDLVVRRHTAFVGSAEHWHYDMFVIHWRDPVVDDIPITFRLDARGAVAVADVAQLGEFTRKAESETAPSGRP